ncbi:unnamed protein product [Phytophthora lilii]|uniref:Unnamed protein product n=1 Tax=Phytophthora lilii TaxID=2077276 RepID=A0A9W6YDK1_9STRA|nr:unnamed protein product [Phytophthora lilii]
MPILYLQSCTHRWHNQQWRNPWWRNQRGFGLNRFGLTGYWYAVPKPGNPQYYSKPAQSAGYTLLDSLLATELP